MFVNNKRQRSEIRGANGLRAEALEALHCHACAPAVCATTGSALRQLGHAAILDKRRAAVGKAFRRHESGIVLEVSIRGFSICAYPPRPFNIMRLLHTDRQPTNGINTHWYQISIPNAAHNVHK